jgi:hypothetical protein
MSFGAMARFRVGYWRGVRSYLLRERQDVSKRIRVIDAEMARIGKIEIQYESASDPESGRVDRTENRMSINATRGSSLEKLLKAYIAQGGNPLDISQFFYPEESEIVGTEADDTPIYNHRYPYGGVAAPVSRDNDTTNEMDGTPEDMPSSGFGENPGGYLNLVRYAPRRIGGRKDLNEEHAVIARIFELVRSWCNQEIKEKLQRLEYKILKLCDAHEQLENEKSIVLQQAFGGVLEGLDSLDSERFSRSLRVQNLMADIDEGLFQTTISGEPILTAADETKVSAVEWAYTDDETEKFLDLMA